MAQCLNLAKSTNDNGFGMLRNFFAYKLSEQGKQLVVIDKWYPSSKTCYPCKSIYHDLKLSDRVWTCPHCGAVLERDPNAANNIKYETCRILGLIS
jgi:putative transposase